MAPLPSLDLQPALDLQSEIWQKFVNRSVFPRVSLHLNSSLLASFGQCKFRLDSSTVGSVLQVALGGSASDFNVIQISVRVFRFSVSCREVGFLINHL
jgi:hypothetical protein